MFVAPCLLLTFAVIVKTQQVPHDCPRFDYEYKLLERILMLEFTQREMTVKMELLKARLAEISSSPATNDTQPTVAFYAGLSHDINAVALGYKAVMDRVFLNQGGAYDVSNGMFRAPFTGVYEFTVHACSSPSKIAHLFMMKEGESVGFTYTVDPNWSCSGRSAVVMMQKGEHIWVEMVGYAAGMYKQSEKHVEYRTSFSGFYIGKI
ncbi:hypothetical protein CHS0354_011136 [Potamilus streckersoni]|uniref:C1q domain-containing protein n=1 Tax=Potamilus streckersoni TaxID=2493646 RepID=A0AAE0RXU0_9BIVA|nr:hypothetical protein CHS0354_011136 [Potamilus streckersoni]